VLVAALAQHLAEDDERAVGVVRQPAARVVNDVGVTDLQARKGGRVQAGVHASDGPES
jgi:hypothetical protein